MDQTIDVATISQASHADVLKGSLRGPPHAFGTRSERVTNPLERLCAGRPGLRGRLLLVLTICKTSKRKVTPHKIQAVISIDKKNVQQPKCRTYPEIFENGDFFPPFSKTYASTCSV